VAGVGLALGHDDAVMAEQGTHGFDVNTTLDKPGSEHVSQVMKTEPRDASRLARLCETQIEACVRFACSFVGQDMWGAVGTCLQPHELLEQGFLTLLAITDYHTHMEGGKLLLELNYVSTVNDRYRGIIPIFDERDEPMVRELRRLGQEVMAKWFDEHYEALRLELTDLKPVRYGVPLSEGFYWVWHYIFGIANRELIAAGLFADPYDDSRVLKGFIPTVYLLGVLQGPI
jgi:hypothetical protein